MPGPLDHLKGQLPSELITAMEDELVNQDTTASVGFASKAVGVVHLYANANTGSDSNTGETADQPKLTLTAVFDLIPEFVRRGLSVGSSGVVVHLTGTFTETLAYIPGTVSDANASTITINGEDPFEVVAGPFTADSSSVANIADSGQSWADDEHMGYWVEILSGSAAGNIHPVAKNDGTTITPTRNFSADPGNVQFQIVRPGTVIDLGSGSGQMIMNGTLNATYQLQNIRLRSQIAIQSGRLETVLVQADMRNSDDRAIWANGRGSQLFTNLTRVSPTTGAYDFSEWGIVTGGLGVAKGEVRADRGATINLAGSSIKGDLQLFSCNISGNLLYQGANVRGGLFVTAVNEQRYALTRPASGFAPVEIRNAASAGKSLGVGIRLLNSSISMDAATIKDCDSHAIEAMGSFLNLTFGVVGGTGNTGAGVYAHWTSTVLARTTAMPTVTGTVGDVSVTNPAAQQDTWANIASTPLVVASELTMADVTTEKLE